MLEAAMTVWFIAIGIVASSIAARHLGVWGTVFAAPIVGSAVYAMTGLLLVWFSSFGTVRALVLASVIAIAAVIASRMIEHQWPPTRTVLVALGVALTIAVAASVAIQALYLTRLTPDSLDYLTMAGSLERYGVMVSFAPDLLLKRQLTTGLLHTVGVLTGLGYFASLTFLLSVSGIALLAWLGNRALQLFALPARWRWAIVGSSTLFVMTTNRVAYNEFYVNGHATFAAFLLVGVGFAWYATATERWSLLVLSTLTFAALVPMRADSVAVAAIFLIPVITSQSIPVWGRWTLAVPFTVTVLVWYGPILHPYLPAAEYRPTGTATVYILVALGLLGVVAASQIPVMKRVVRMSPWLMPLLLGAFIAWRARRGFSVLLKSLGATGSNIGAYGLWSAFWWVAPLLVVAALIVVVVPRQRFFTIGLLTFPLALLAFTYLRGSPYRVGAGDSGNRMLMHVVLVLVLYVMMAAGIAYRDTFMSDASPPPLGEPAGAEVD